MSGDDMSAELLLLLWNQTLARVLYSLARTSDGDDAAVELQREAADVAHHTRFVMGIEATCRCVQDYGDRGWHEGRSAPS